MRRLSIVSAVAICGLAVACGKKPSNPSQDAMRAQLEEFKKKFPAPPSGPEKTGDPCSLLDTAEVSAAIGPLAGPPYRGTYKPMPRDGSCRYDTKDARRVLLEVDWSGGATAMKMVHFGRSLTDQAMQGVTKTGKTLLATGDTVTGDWDEVAAMPMQCCMLAALRGDQFVQIDWTGTRLTTTAAAALLNKALGRLDHQLTVNSGAGVAAGNQRWDAESKDSLVDVCALVSQKDAEAILGSPLIAPPSYGDPRGATKRSCSYQTPMPGGGRMHFTCELELHEWHDAHASFTEDQWVINRGGHAVARMATGVADSMTGKTSGASGTSAADTAAADTAAAAASAPTSGPPGPWDEAGSSVSGGLEAVRGNVLMRAGSMGRREQCNALLGKALTAMKP